MQCGPALSPSACAAKPALGNGIIAHMTALTIYGIPNCDGVKKARTWFTEQGMDYVFHDFKKQGVPTALLTEWLAALGHETLINRKGPTWRNLDEATRSSVVNNASAIPVIQAHSSIIKRPVVVWPQGGITVGFTPERFEVLRNGLRAAS